MSTKSTEAAEDGIVREEKRANYKQRLNEKGRIAWEVGHDDDFEDVRDELAEVHRRWVEAGLSDDPEAGQ